MPRLQDVYQCDAPVALITGSGAPRVGRAIAKQLARMGCQIALHAHTSVEEAERVASKLRSDCQIAATVVVGSLENPDVPERLVREVNRQHGRLDILVNSAAIWYPTRLEEIEPDEVLRYFKINALASLLTARAAGLVMADQTSGGSIVNIGDWATVRPYLDHAAYFPSKGAVEVMTRSLAVELAHRNPSIRVNCIQPGPVLLADDVSPDHARAMASSTLVGRVGTAEHVAEAVQFLCENDFVTGVCLAVDGGRSIYAPDGLQVGMNTG
jgi:NAD(P)-dependent dehydrogenase (short-subunit alcohol dehydrogenase family)